MEDCVMEDFDNLLQLQQQQPGEAELKKKMKTLPDDFSTHCTLTSSTDDRSDMVQPPCEGDLGAVRLLGGCKLEEAVTQEEIEGGQEKQQHGKGKQLKKKNTKKIKNGKKKKKNKRGAIRATNLRRFTPEEHAVYHKQVVDTEGFGVLVLPFDVITCDVVPCPPRDRDEAAKDVDMANKAIGVYNNDNGTSYKVVKVIRTNCFCVGGGVTEFFITFQAKDFRAGLPLQNFQADICYSWGETDVIFCRVEPKSKLPEGPGETSQQRVMLV